MGNELIKSPATELRQAEELATHFIKSGFFSDTRDLSKAVTKILMGRQLGLDPLASMSQIYLMQGKLQMGAHLIGRLIKDFRDDGRKKYRYEILESTQDVCTLQLFERVDTGPSSWEWVKHQPFTRKREEYKHLLGGQNWKNHGRDMLFARTITSMGRMLCPEVMGGNVYAPDELPGTEDNYDPETQSIRRTDIPSFKGDRQMPLKEMEEILEADFQKITAPTKRVALHQELVGLGLPEGWALEVAELESMSQWDSMSDAQARKLKEAVEAYKELHQDAKQQQKKN